MQQQWYGAKSVYLTRVYGKPGKVAPESRVVSEDLGLAFEPLDPSAFDPYSVLLEERVVLIRASSFKVALRKAEREALAYEGSSWNNLGQRLETRRSGPLEVFLAGQQLEENLEVFSRSTVARKSDGGKRKEERDGRASKAFFEPDLWQTSQRRAATRRRRSAKSRSSGKKP